MSEFSSFLRLRVEGVCGYVEVCCGPGLLVGDRCSGFGGCQEVMAGGDSVWLTLVLEFGILFVESRFGSDLRFPTVEESGVFLNGTRWVKKGAPRAGQ